MKDDAQLARTCQLCGATEKDGGLVPAALVRPTIVDMIRNSHPDWQAKGYICLSDLNRFRGRYVESLLTTDKGELTALEKDVLLAMANQEILAEHIDAQFEQQRTYGQQMSDSIAKFGGSWKFISVFMGVLVLWIILNSLLLLWRPFDPYPFILLNLILSCIAALQAPIIMMSQNRQEAKDRLRAENDYRVNLKAELEIRHLHEKVDHLLTHQWERLVEIQQVQLEIMNELVGKEK